MAVDFSVLVHGGSGSTFQVWWRRWIVCSFAINHGCFMSQRWLIWLMVVMPSVAPSSEGDGWPWGISPAACVQSQVFTSSPETWVQMTDGILSFSNLREGTRSFVLCSDSTGSNTCRCIFKRMISSWAHSYQNMCYLNPKVYYTF